MLVRVYTGPARQTRGVTENGNYYREKTARQWRLTVGNGRDDV